MKHSIRYSKGTFLITFLAATFGVIVPKSTASDTASVTPCAMEAGVPKPDQTSICKGGFTVALPLINTDLALVYDSNPSKLDEFYDAKNTSSYDYFGAHWRLQVDASVILSANNTTATVVLGDGTGIEYKQVAESSLYDPVDPRQTQSTLEFSRSNTAKRLMSDGTVMTFGFRDTSGVYHLTSQIAPSGQEVLNFTRSPETGEINAISGVGFKNVTLTYSESEGGIKLVDISNELNQKITLKVSPDGLLRSVQFPSPPDSIDLVNTFDYDDGSARITRFQDYLERVNSISYHPSGAVSSIVDYRNMATRFSYASNSVTMKNAQGISTHHFSNGRLTEIVDDSSGSRTTFTRDSDGRVVTIDHNDLKTHLTYPGVNDKILHKKFPTAIMTPDGLTKTIEYWPAAKNGQRWLLVKREVTSGPLGSMEKNYSYDDLGRKTELIAGKATYRYSYHGSTRLLRQTKLNGVVLNSASFDNKGNLVLFSDASGMRNYVGRNATSGLVQSVRNGYDTKSFNWDPLGRLISVQSDEGRVSLGYGVLGNVEYTGQFMNSGESYEKRNTIKITD